MPTKLSVWNEALSILGRAPINDPEEASETTRVLADHWSRSPTMVFEEATWNCAVRRVALQRSATAPTFGYLYYYPLPADCSRIITVSDSGNEGDAFEAWTEEAGKIATDATTLYLVYVKAGVIDTPGAWTQALADYISADIAERAAPRLASDKLEHAMGMRKRRRKHALAQDAMRSPPRRLAHGQWVSARLGNIRNSEQGR